MKDSGVEWLGEIPAHWEVKRLKRLVAMGAGSAITSESIEPSGNYPVFGGNGIRGFTDSFTHDGEFPLIGRQGALCGCVNLASGKFWASEHAVVARPAQDVDAFWLADLLAAMSLNSYSQSAAQPGLAVETIAAIHAPAPPVTEQRAIAAFLDRETARIDALVAKVRDAIEHLKELRTALISAAVTGKIDVRG
jgi:type I restriction enzyme S subunit